MRWSFDKKKGVSRSRGHTRPRREAGTRPQAESKPHLLAAHAIPDAVAGEDHETILVRHLHGLQVRLGRDHLLGRGNARVRLVLEVADGAGQVEVAVHPPRLFQVVGSSGWINNRGFEGSGRAGSGRVG